MIKKNQKPIHPSKYVWEKIILQSTTDAKTANQLEIGREELSKFLNCKTSLSHKVPQWLEQAFGADREFLLNLQTQYDG